MNELFNDCDAEKSESLSQSGKITETLGYFGEDFGFDEETCTEIAEMPFEEAFETAYSYLVQAEIDPEEALCDFMEGSE